MSLYCRHFLKFDIPASVVVFLVAIPLCLGIALASDAPLFSGIIAGIIGGIVVGSISQSPVSVSGPAAGLAAVVAAAIAQLGGFQSFLLALMLAGVLQIIIGVWRAGFIANYIPMSVIQGLLCAIGLLIILKQLPLAFTYVAHAVSFNVNRINAGAACISIISILMLIFFDKTKIKFLKFIPGPVAVVLLGILINEFYRSFMPSLTQANAELVNIPVNHLSQFFNQFQLPAWREWKNPLIYMQAFIIATVASLETLLNIEATEKLATDRRRFSRNRELIAQGVGNALCGLMGGLPITSVIVRSSVNIQAGAKTKLSTIIHGLLILSVVTLIPHFLNCIPLASLATILIYVGYKLTKLSIYREMYRLGWSQFIPFVTSVLAIVLTNLLMGILIGLITAFLFIFKNGSQIQLDITKEMHPSGSVIRMILPQQVTFLLKASLIAELGAVPKNSRLIIDARCTKHIDRDVLELIDIFSKQQAPDKDISLNLIGFKEVYF